MANSKSGHLPADGRPFHYDLTLEPDLEKFNFHGSVEIGYDSQEGNRSDLTDAGLMFYKPQTRSLSRRET